MVFGLLTVPLMAFAGALGATLIVPGVLRIAQATSADRLVLAGVAVSFIIMAGANALIFLGDPRATHTVVFWMLGGSASRSGVSCSGRGCAAQRATRPQRRGIPHRTLQFSNCEEKDDGAMAGAADARKWPCMTSG
jgi:hypothetical protein